MSGMDEFLHPTAQCGRDPCSNLDDLVNGYMRPLLQTWISNYIHNKVGDEITYPYPNFAGCTIEVYEWIYNFIPDFTEQFMTYPGWG